MEKLKVVELFAGVGGFRLGLENNNFKVVWSNQWEPSTKVQHASMVYEKRFGSKNHSNVNIEDVPTNDIPLVPPLALITPEAVICPDPLKKSEPVIIA